jgi:EpsI family protein
VRGRLLTFLLLLVATATAAGTIRARAVRAANGASLDRVPLRIGPWIGADLDLQPGVMGTLRADEALNRLYVGSRQRGGEFVHLFIAYFASQETGGQIHSPKNCIPAGGWVIQSRSKRRVETAEGPQTVNEFVIKKGATTQLVRYWFLTRSGTVDNEFALKWDLVWNSMVGRPTDAALVRLVTIAPPQEIEAARERLGAFGSALRPGLDQAIPIGPESRRAARAF